MDVFCFFTEKASVVLGAESRRDLLLPAAVLVGSYPARGCSSYDLLTV